MEHARVHDWVDVVFAFALHIVLHCQIAYQVKFDVAPRPADKPFVVIYPLEPIYVTVPALFPYPTNVYPERVGTVMPYEVVYVVIDCVRELSL